MATNNAALNNLLSFLHIPTWAIILFIALATVNITCTVSLFVWRKLGFFVLCTSAAAALL
jgi:hypothetical protein